MARIAAFCAVDSNIIHVRFPTRPADVQIFVEGAPVSENHNRATAGQISKKNGRRQFQTGATLAWRGAVMVALRNVLHGRKLTAPLAVACVFVNCRADLDNLVKTTWDGIADATGVNDRHYHPFQADKQRHKGHPKGAVIALWGSDGPGGDAA
jgi:Holliday junction resolvase RusA-like endonuclease